MADRMVGGNLASKLVAYRRNGMSWEAVASRLFADYGVEVTAQTLRMWGRDLDLGPERASA